MNLTSIMKRVELFRGLDEAQLQRLGQISHREEYVKNATVFEQDDPGDKMYIVSDGQVEVRVRDPKGNSRAVLYLGEGQVFGEMALIDEGRRSASVLAVENDTVVYSIPSKDFTDLCKSDTGIGYIMMRNLALDLTFKLRHRDFDPSKS
jgi:CRP/FNR family transcriptional regulator, cyclic AMP receptor protein